MPVDKIIATIRRYLLLDQAAFEEVRDDRAFTPYAVAVAGLSILIAGFGTFLWAVITDAPDQGDFFVEGTILGSIFAFLLWAAGVGVAYLILAQLYKEGVTPDAVFRLAGIALVPFALGLLVFIPALGFGFGILSIALVFFFMFYALRTAYPAIEPLRVLIAVIAAVAVFAMILPIISSSDNAYAPGVFVYEWAEDVVRSIFDVEFFFDDFNDFFDDLEFNGPDNDFNME